MLNCPVYFPRLKELLLLSFIIGKFLVCSFSLFSAFFLLDKLNFPGYFPKLQRAPITFCYHQQNSSMLWFSLSRICLTPHIKFAPNTTTFNIFFPTKFLFSCLILPGTSQNFKELQSFLIIHTNSMPKPSKHRCNASIPLSICCQVSIFASIIDGCTRKEF